MCIELITAAAAAAAAAGKGGADDCVWWSPAQAGTSKPKQQHQLHSGTTASAPPRYRSIAPFPHSSKNNPQTARMAIEILLLNRVGRGWEVNEAADGKCLMGCAKVSETVWEVIHHNLLHICQELKGILLIQIQNVKSP